MVDLSPLPRLFAASDWPAAERLLRRASKAKQAPAAVFYNLAKVLEAQGKHAQRETWLKRAAATDPNHVSAWFELGRVMLDEGRLAEAERAFSRVAMLAPEDQEARFLLLRLRLRLCDWEGAAEVLPSLPHCPETHVAAYRIAAERGEATEDMRTALLANATMRADALKALTRVSKGSLPLVFPKV